MRSFFQQLGKKLHYLLNKKSTTNIYILIIFSHSLVNVIPSPHHWAADYLHLYSSTGGSTHLPCSFISSIRASVAFSIAIARFTTVWKFVTNQTLFKKSNYHYLSWVEEYDYLANIKVDLSWGTTNVTKIGIRHFSRTIHNATHDCNLWKEKKKHKQMIDLLFWREMQLVIEGLVVTETPGKWEVLSLISALISWRSNRVLPQDGHDTYSWNQLNRICDYSSTRLICVIPRCK